LTVNTEGSDKPAADTGATKTPTTNTLMIATLSSRRTAIDTP